MTLQERFDIISCKDCDMPYCDIKCTILSDNELDRIEKISDEFAIGFAEWLGANNYKKYSNGWANMFTKATPEKELLEIYKKEKRL